MQVHLLILNYNGRALLGECLPSVLAAAAASRHSCDVTVIDNDSTDDSVTWLSQAFPQVRVLRRPNRGLCSFNDVLAELPGPVAVLLNNDVKLFDDCIDPLVGPLVSPPAHGERPCFMTAPRAWLFDEKTFEGFRTAVRWRWGLVQATALYPKHERTMHEAGPTASAGAALAVDRRRFLALGGFDPLYLPGRLEDLDFAYRGYQAGFQALYVPAAQALHRGQATYDAVHGQGGSHVMALRNTLLFQWKNLRHPVHLLRQVLSLPVRLAHDVLRAPWQRTGYRLALCRALAGALRKNGTLSRGAQRPVFSTTRERAFFIEFSPERMSLPADQRQLAEQHAHEERRRAKHYPLSRWYVRPLAGQLAECLAYSPVRPWHLTVCGLLAAVAAVGLLLAWPGASPWAAALVLLAWFFDRADGQLARRQQRASPHGAWLDANVDELVDLGLHVAMAAAAAWSSGSTWPWALLVAFLFGKYLLMYGLAVDDPPAAAVARDRAGLGARGERWLRAIYHLPGSADVRVHLLALGLLTGWLTTELALVACYYNVRWLVRYVLVARRPVPLCQGGMGT